MTGRLTLISHAATEAQRHAAFPTDEPVSNRELAKIVSFHRRSPRAQHILSAPEQRTQQTARALGLSAITIEELRDCDYGRWKGYELSRLQTNDPNEVLAWLTDPASAPHGGESVENVIARIGRWLDQRRDTGHTLAVTHPAIIRGAIVYALGIPAQTFWRFDVAPLSLTDLRFNGRVWTVRSTSAPLAYDDLGNV